MRVLVAALLLGLCAYQAFARLEQWRSDEALWTAAVAVSPGTPRPALNLAVALDRRGASAEARVWAVKAHGLALQRQSIDAQGKAHALITWIDLVRLSPDCASLSC